ncbi:MAG: bifunctional serine/threonine-protein kinase/ABC transporter substrate-binding protein [Kofleriaceae bacterium]
MPAGFHGSSGPDPSEPASPEPPLDTDGGARTFGRYELFAKLGSGGQADVFLAVARGTLGVDKLVVIKRAKPGLSEDPVLLGDFLDEARFTLQLNHPNLVHTYEVGQEEGAHFLAMEHIEGLSLKELFGQPQSRAFAPAIWLRIIADALGGLAHAHGLRDYDGKPLGIVHRDISPHNILVSFDGVTKVLDFGIAKAAGDGAPADLGGLTGKAAYMAPEQLHGNADRRSDLFAMGVVLWEMLAGRRLFQGDAASIQEQLIHQPIPRLRDVRMELDPEVDELVARALEKAAPARYQTANEMRQTIDRYLRRTGQNVRELEVSEAMSTAFGERRARLQAQIQRAMAASEGAARPAAAPATTSTAGRATAAAAVTVAATEPVAVTAPVAEAETVAEPVAAAVTAPVAVTVTAPVAVAAAVTAPVAVTEPVAEAEAVAAAATVTAAAAVTVTEPEAVTAPEAVTEAEPATVPVAVTEAEPVTVTEPEAVTATAPATSSPPRAAREPATAAAPALAGPPVRSWLRGLALGAGLLAITAVLVWRAARDPDGTPAAASGPPRAAAAACATPLHVRVMYDMTGATKEVGTAAGKGEYDYLRALNDRGGIRGCKLELDVQDTRYDERATLDVYAAWKARPDWAEVSTIFVQGTPMTQILGPMAAEAGKVIISGAYGGELAAPVPTSAEVAVPSLSGAFAEASVLIHKQSPGYPYVFFQGTDYTTAARVAATFAWRQGARRMAFFYCSRSRFCTEPVDGAKTFLKALGGTEIGRDLFLELDDDDATVERKVAEFFTQERARKASHPEYQMVDWIWFGNTSANSPALGHALDRALDRARAQVRVIGNNWSVDESLYARCGDACVGFYVVQPFALFGDVTAAGTAQLLADHQRYRLLDGEPADAHRTVQYVYGRVAVATWKLAVEQLLDRGLPVTGANLRAALESFRQVDVEGFATVGYSASDHRPQSGARVARLGARGQLEVIGQPLSLSLQAGWLGW